MSKNQTVSGIIGPPGTVAVGQPQPGTIAYPNNVQDKQVVFKLREIIDHLNQTKTSVIGNLNSTAENTKAITAIQNLPPPLSTNDVNSQINIALGTNGAITAYVVKLLKASGVNVPDTLPPLV